ncbi:MAG: PAS-domain containing protein [Alphaproteobacteria bacterium]|nr:PAS-domain containing protein [Alphaproteobacteria bacterium]
MPDWLTTVSTLLAGTGIGLVAARSMWQTTLDNGKPPAWIPEKIAGTYFRNIEKSQQEIKRTRLENENLRRELRQFSSLLNLSPFPVWRRDENLMVQYCNLTYTAMLEDVPERILEEYGMELSQSARKLAEKALENKDLTSESRHLIIEGQRKQYNIYEMPDNDLGGTIGFAIDTTERERVEEDLRRHNRAHSDLLEASNMATAIFDTNRQLKFYNSAFVSLWRLDKNWLDEEPSYTEIIEHLREKRRMPEVLNFQQFKQQRIRLFTDLMETYEEILHLPDGRIVRLLVIPHALGGLIFSFEDVTDKLALERSYNTLIAVQRETLNNLHEGVAVFGEDGRLRLSNPIYQKLWGLNENFLESDPHIGEILDKTQSYYTYQHWGEFKERMITQLHVRKMNYQRIERSDGSVIDWSTVPLPDGATLITYFDVTDSTLVERSLIEKNEALREADRLKTEFLLSVSYELRSPLTSITGFAEILKEEYFGELNEKQREYLEAVHDSASQLGQLINNILDLASIEAGYMRLEITDCNITTILNDVFSLFKERAKNNEVELVLKCPKGIGIMQADEARIKQVLFNLLNNALKFTKSDGLITLGAKVANGDNIELWVEDNGMGIPEQEQRSVFERFRAGAIRTQRSGAGLGLAMVKNFVELHGGRVELNSELNNGTRISCFIPRIHPAIYTHETLKTPSGSPLAQIEADAKKSKKAKRSSKKS